MNNLVKNLISFFKKKEQQPPKIKVCWDFLAKILGYMLITTDKDLIILDKLDDHDPKVLREIIREYVVPHYRYFPPENQEKIKNSLAYYLTTDSEKLKWVFPSYQIPIDDTVAKLFYTIVWKELYGTDFPEPINPDDYEEDCSSVYINSLHFCGDLEKKYNPTGQEPSVGNILERLRQNP